MYHQNIKITNEAGLHTRFSAMFVNKASEISSKRKVNLYIKKETQSNWLGISMLGLLALKVNVGEILSIGCKELSESGRLAVSALIDYVENNINLSNSHIEKIDEFIDESNIANEQMLDELPIGILAIDVHENITKINSHALLMLGTTLTEALGSQIKNFIPNSGLIDVLKTQKKDLGKLLHINNRTTMVNRSPLFSHGELIGAIAVIQDIKELIDKLEKSEEELNFYKEEFIKNISNDSFSNEIIGSHGTLKDIIYISKKAGMSTSTVLVRGESGTGKELIAKFIHNSSKRKDMPFVKINCAAIPENLLESELFGYEKGAFTGAIKSKPGKFEIADGGTIFLDEIGDMPLSMQVKLLRTLQEREIERLGSIESKKVDVRVIAATNRNLEDMMKDGTFREDLYYRLNVLSVILPPLKDRKFDIPELTEYFINKLNPKINTKIKSIDLNALKILQSYNFPGNIRELENIIERAMNLCRNDSISIEDLPPYLLPSNKESNDVLKLDEDNILPFEEYEKRIIEAALKKYKSFNKTGKALGLTHRTISLKCKKYNITFE